MLIGVSCLLKGIVGLTFSDYFYQWRRAHYTSAQTPSALFAAPSVVAAVVAVTWYATLFHYSPWGWIVTAFVTATALLGTANLVRWKQYRGRALRAVDNTVTRRCVDVMLLVIGAGFVALAMFVY